MNSQVKLVATVIWFSILFGVFIFQLFIGGGFGIFAGEMKVQSIPLMAIGLFPLVVGVFGRMLVIPGARNDTDFIIRLVICLALCEAPFFIGLLLIAPEFSAERAFTFIGAVIGILALFPLTIKYGKDAPGQAANIDPYHSQQ